MVLTPHGSVLGGLWDGPQVCGASGVNKVMVNCFCGEQLWRTCFGPWRTCVRCFSRFITVYYCLLLFITSSIFDLFCHMINVLHKCWVWFYMSPFQTLHFVGPSLNSGVELGSSLVVGATLALAQKPVLNETPPPPPFHPRWLPHPLLPFYLPSRCGCSVLDSGLFSLLFSPSDEQ